MGFPPGGVQTLDVSVLAFGELSEETQPMRILILQGRVGSLNSHRHVMSEGRSLSSFASGTT